MLGDVVGTHTKLSLFVKENGKMRRSQSGKLENPGKKFFLKLAADSIRDVNSQKIIMEYRMRESNGANGHVLQLLSGHKGVHEVGRGAVVL